MRNVVLVGFMGTGKSVVGKRVAAELGWPFYDTDQLIEAKAGMKVSRIFETKGEEAFRSMEREVVAEISQRDGCVISTGGGVVADPENVRRLTEKGELICLVATPEVILKRIERRRDARPLLLEGDPLVRIKTLLEQRRPYYAQASFSLDTTFLSIEKIVEAILRRMKSAHA